MSKAVKLRNDLYLDTRGIVHKGKILADILYPVGSIYITMEINKNPATIFGGEWVQIKDCFLWATNGPTTGTTGGSRTTNEHILTVEEIPPHSHYYYGHYGYNRDAASTLGWNLGDTDYNNYNVSTTGGGKGHSHTFMPPYFEVYMWYRKA